MEPGYVCRTFLRTKSPATLLRSLRYTRHYRASRGMAFRTEVRDRLGGWPHGPAGRGGGDRLLRGGLGLTTGKVAKGEENIECLLAREGA